MACTSRALRMSRLAWNFVGGPRVNLSDGDERSGLLGDVCGGGLGDLCFDGEGELGEVVVADDPSELSLGLEEGLLVIVTRPCAA